VKKPTFHISYFTFHRQNGFTLPELIVVTVIIGMVMAGISVFLTNGVKFVRLTQARIEIQRDARLALSVINKDLRQAKASTVVIDRANSSMPPYSRLYFETIQGSTVCYYQDGTTLKYQKTENGITSAPHKLTENLRYAAFAYQRTDNNKILHVSICLEKIPYPYVAGARALQVSIEQVRIMNE